MKKIGRNLACATIIGLTAALPVYATGPDITDRTLQVAFGGPFLAWLAYAYNIRVNGAMDPKGA